jgi:hypothetical protein
LSKDKDKVEVKRPWLARNLETGKKAILVEEDTDKGKKFKKVGDAKGKDKNN